MLGSCLLSAFLFFSVAFGAEKTNAEETQYQQLQRDWWQIFPDGNRNAGGPKFFNYALNISKNFTEFQTFNKLFCPVSGSLINPNSIPEFVYINEEGSSRKICGKILYAAPLAQSATIFIPLKLKLVGIVIFANSV